VSRIAIRGNGRALGLILIASMCAFGSSCKPARRPPLPAEQLEKLFSVRLVFPDPGPGRTLVEVPGFAASEPLYVAAEDVITLAQVQDVEYTSTGGQSVLAFLLSLEGRSRMAEATKHHVGKRMAFYVEGAPDSAPLLQAPILDGEFHVSGGKRSDDELRALEGKLRDGLGL
jgi:hypothetical protein